MMVNDKEHVPPHLQEFQMPSDSQYRADMQPLKDKNFDEAEKQKTMLEEQQRMDKKRRQAAEKARKKQ